MKLEFNLKYEICGFPIVIGCKLISALPKRHNTFLALVP